MAGNSKTTSIFSNGIVLPKASGYGIKVNTSNPAFGYKDLIGQIIPRSGGSPAPAFTAFRGANILEYAFQVGDKIDKITFHIPHDYVPNTHLYLHHHWGHNGTAIGGDLNVNYYVSYCKGYNQTSQTFNAQLTIPNNTALGTPAISTYPRWSHNIAEIQLSNTGGDATHLDTGLIEIDGLIEVAMEVITIPTITGSATSNLPYIFFVDVHYQSTQSATKDKNYPFYT